MPRDPRRRGRPRRPETPESEQFRLAMMCETLAERHPAVNHAALEVLAKIAMVSQGEEDPGDVLLVLEPLVPYADHSDFDRGVCATGLKDFIRPRMKSDLPPELAALGPFPPYVRVREVTPGLRYRLDINLSPRSAPTPRTDR